MMEYEETEVNFRRTAILKEKRMLWGIGSEEGKGEREVLAC